MGQAESAKQHVDHFYDDDICQWLDPTVKPSQIRSAFLNELSADRPAPRLVSWSPVLKRCVSVQLKRT